MGTSRGKMAYTRDDPSSRRDPVYGLRSGPDGRACRLHWLVRQNGSVHIDSIDHDGRLLGVSKDDERSPRHHRLKPKKLCDTGRNRWRCHTDIAEPDSSRRDARRRAIFTRANALAPNLEELTRLNGEDAPTDLGLCQFLRTAPGQERNHCQKPA